MEGKKPESIDYYTYEGAMARSERHAHRWMIACIIIFIALIATNTGWIIYDAQFEDIVMTQEATTDGGGDNIINGAALGDVNYGYDSETDNQNP